jgi:hypothetical protein
MHDLLECETEYVRACEVVALFCCQVKKWIGAFAVGPGRVDALWCPREGSERMHAWSVAFYVL